MRKRASGKLSILCRWVLIIILTMVLASCSESGYRRLRQTLVSNKHAQNALNMATNKLGSPYVWGGQGPDEFDCSGLIIWAYEQVVPNLYLRLGNEIVRDVTQDDLWKFNVQPVPPQHMRPGDIVFITNDPDRMTHGGLFIEWVDEGKTEFRFVNASSYYKAVVIDTWSIMEEKRGQWFAGAGRLLISIN